MSAKGRNYIQSKQGKGILHLYMKIYLAGSVPKGDEEQKTFRDWRKDYQLVLKDVFIGALFIDPYDCRIDERDFFSVFGFDCKHIQQSDLVIVNAESRLGVGTSQEMVIAKYFKKPLVTVLPFDTFHRRSHIVFQGQNVEDWIHPFIHSFSDHIIEKVENIRKLKTTILSQPVKSISIIDQAIQYIDRIKESRENQGDTSSFL